MAVEPLRAIPDKRLYALHDRLERHRKVSVFEAGYNTVEGQIVSIGHEISSLLGLPEQHEQRGFESLFFYAVALGHSVGDPDMQQRLPPEARGDRKLLLGEGAEHFFMLANDLEVALPSHFGVEIGKVQWHQRFDQIKTAALVLGLLFAEPQLSLTDVREKLAMYQTRLTTPTPT